MLFLLIAAGLVAAWAWKKSRIGFGDVAAGVALLIAMRLFATGRIVPGLIGIAVAGGWLWLRARRTAFLAPVTSSEDARLLLNVPRDAEETEIRAAHRRLVAKVHPDAGGSAELTRRVNAARDTLLAEIAAARRS